MARKFYTPLSLTGLELQNFKIQNLADNPSPYGKGHAYYNTVANELRVYDGTHWNPVGGSIEYGAIADRPSAGNVGRVYAATDTQTLYLDNGSTWLQIGMSATATTDNVTEGSTNLYFTNARARGSVSGSSGVSYDSASGTFSADYTAIETQLQSDGYITGSEQYIQSVGSEFSVTSHALALNLDATLHVNGSNNLAVQYGAGLTTNGSGYLAVDETVIATKSYVDATAQGLSVLGSVRAASTANITIAGTSVIDGVNLANNDRVLLKNQSTASQNGIYIYSSVSGLQASTSAEDTIAKGSFVFVEGGSQVATGWVVTSYTTGASTWAQFSAAGEYTAGNGIDISGKTISAVVQGTEGMQLTSGGIGVNAGTGLEFNGSTGALQVTDYTSITKKYATSIGNGSSTSFDVTHNLNTEDVVVTIYDATTKEEVFADVTHVNTSKVTVVFAVAPSSNAFRVVVVG